MNDRLGARTQPAINEISVGVAKQEEYLKKQHAGGKNSGCAAEPWKNIFCDYQLHLKQQKRTAKHCKAKERRPCSLGRGQRRSDCLRPVGTASQIWVHSALPARSAASLADSMPVKSKLARTSGFLRRSSGLWQETLLIRRAVAREWLRHIQNPLEGSYLV